MRVNFMANEVDAKIAIVGAPADATYAFMEHFRSFASPRGKVTWTDRAQVAIDGGAVWFDFVPTPPVMIDGRSLRIHLYGAHAAVSAEARAFVIDGADVVLSAADLPVEAGDPVAAAATLKAALRTAIGRHRAAT